MVLSLAGRGLAARKSGIKLVLLFGGGGTGVLVVGVVLILVLAVGLGDGAQITTTLPGGESCPVGAVTCTGEAFDPGNIISDNEFTNAEHAGPRRFRIERRQYVALGGDGFWRVDVAAVGG